MADVHQKSAEVSDSLLTDASISSSILNELIDHISSNQELNLQTDKTAVEQTADQLTEQTHSINQEEEEQIAIVKNISPSLDICNSKKEISDANIVNSNLNENRIEVMTSNLNSSLEDDKSQNKAYNVAKNTKSSEIIDQDNNLEDVIMLDDDSPTQSKTELSKDADLTTIFQTPKIASDKTLDKTQEIDTNSILRKTFAEIIDLENLSEKNSLEEKSVNDLNGGKEENSKQPLSMTTQIANTAQSSITSTSSNSTNSNSSHVGPVKRNVAMKNTSAGLFKQQQPQQTQPQPSSVVSSNAKLSATAKKSFRIHPSADDHLNFKEESSFNYDSNDEYIPPKREVGVAAGSDGSDLEITGETIGSKRKSLRQTKKPKIFNEYIVETSSLDAAGKPQQLITQLQELDNLILNNKAQQIKNKPNEQPNNAFPKHFARKSTASSANVVQNATTAAAGAGAAGAVGQHAKSTKPVTNASSSSGINSVTIVSSSGQSAGTGASKHPQITPILNGTSATALQSNHSKTSHSNSTSIKPTNAMQNNTSNNLQNSMCASSTSTSSTSVGSAANVQLTPAVKQYRNKIISCKPFCESKGTQCIPISKDVATQIDLDEIKLSHTIVPVPVPLSVPLPMCMYQAPMPVPLILPVPIPIPIFIPTTKKTFDRLERRIKKLRKKLPSDPYEFEILLYAEKLAREEGIPGFEDSSDGESDVEAMDTSKPNLFDNSRSFQITEADLQKSQAHSAPMLSTVAASAAAVTSATEPDQTFQSNSLQLVQSEQEGSFKWIYGVRIFNTWLSGKVDQMKQSTAHQLVSLHQRLPDDLLKLKNEELNWLLSEFVHEIRKPSGEAYAPESIYYLCLGIQYYLQEKGRVENIFLDYDLFDKFQESLNEVAQRYQIRIDPDGHITSRIEEEILWESKQLGAYSPFVLLNTILYFNTKYFFLDKPESHMQLSFTNVKKHSKRNIGPNGEDFGKTVFLRYYPDFHGLEQVIYEQGENYDNPLRCPVELYNFYLSKCPESVKNRNDVFYLIPEKATLPSSPVWFSSQPLGVKMLERMLNRIKMVKEVNELLLAASPASASATIIQ